MTSSFHEFTALEAVHAIQTRQITASAYTAALLSRIEACESEVQAWHYLDPQHARNQAAKLDAHGDLKSLPLAGAAVGVKDIIDTADMPTENGTVLEAGRAISAVDYAGALRERERHYRQLEALVAPYDAILTPSSTGRRRAD